ncbi:MAG: response regulator [Ignavibacteriota bacterium]
MFNILFVEDNPGDVALLKILVQKLKQPHGVYFTVDGIDALDFLHRRGAYCDAPRPNLILADMNMPRMSGYELLVQIKSDADLSTIPIIILSTCTDVNDIEKVYAAHANCYVSKPGTLSRADQFIHAVEAFWMDVAVLPPCDDRAATLRAAKLPHK